MKRWMVSVCGIALFCAFGIATAHTQSNLQQLQGTTDSQQSNTTENPITLKVYATMEGAMIISDCSRCTINELLTVVGKEHSVFRSSSFIHLFAIGGYVHALMPLTNSMDIGLMTGAIFPFAGSWQPVPMRIPIKVVAKLEIIDWLALMPEAGLMLVADRAVEGFGLNGDVAFTLHILQTIDVRVGLLSGSHFGLYGGIGVAVINIPFNGSE